MTWEAKSQEDKQALFDRFQKAQDAAIVHLTTLVELSIIDKRFTQARMLTEQLEVISVLKGPIGAHNLEADEMRYADAGSKIEAIKAYRARTDTDIRTAKEEVEKYLNLRQLAKF